MAGSIPIKPMGWVFRSESIALVVAVLHATTMSFDDCLISQFVNFPLLSSMSAAVSAPYGANALSEI